MKLTLSYNSNILSDKRVLNIIQEEFNLTQKYDFKKIIKINSFLSPIVRKIFLKQKMFKQIEKII